MVCKITISTKCGIETLGDFALSTRNGRELVYFGKQGTINRKLKAHTGERFNVTIEKVKA